LCDIYKRYQMGINANIYLPAHVKTEHVFQVIQKTVGAEFLKSTFNDQKHTYVNGRMKTVEVPVPFDPDTPASESNPWRMELADNAKGAIELTDVSYFRFTFYDMADNHYMSLYHLETEETERALEPGCKSLNPPPTTAWCVIGKRLVDFFGGKMMYSDTMDEDDPDNWYHNDSPIFPVKSPEQSSNDRWYQYHNALNETPMISVKEMKEMEDYAGYANNERDIKLLEVLTKFERFQALDSKLEDKPTSSVKKTKI
jgi:hypothetical protein